MKKHLIFHILLALCIFTLSEAVSEGQARAETFFEEQFYTVEEVIDGDTLKLSNGETVRLIGIDCPENEYRLDEAAYLNQGKKWERSRDFLKKAKEAREFVRKLVEGKKEVRLEFDVENRDKNGRLLAYVYADVCRQNVDCSHSMNSAYEYKTFDDGHRSFIFLNATIIKAGYASPLIKPLNVKYEDLFKRASQEARQNKRGLWKENEQLLTEKEAVEIAKLAIKDSVNYPEDVSTTVDLKGDIYVVTFEISEDEKKVPPGYGWLGPDYHAQVSVDAVSGEVLKIMVGS